MTAARRLRIAGGSRRGLRLEAPAGIRPSSGRLREALFSIWAERLAGCRFLDLFAGSGAVGLEAASRGARRVLLVEGDRRVLPVLERNRRRAALPAAESLFCRLPAELRRRLPRGERFDLVFADPPYAFAGHAALLAAIAPRLAPGGEVALEHGRGAGEPEAPPALVARLHRSYGDSMLSIFELADAVPGSS